MAVSRGFGDGRGETKINLATDRGYGGSLGFQAGVDVQTLRRSRCS